MIVLVALLMTGVLTLVWIIRAASGKDMRINVVGWGLKVQISTNDPLGEQSADTNYSQKEKEK